ncbi:histone-lysine N-methyltransferase SETMAR [Trichonephila clavipes]|nr:histone-lysine N-methyltransferase SETMAR [Trichonephila clavipes]
MEVRAVIRCLWAKNVPASAINKQHGAKICHSLQSGRQDAESRNMIRSSRPSSSTTAISTARIEEMIQNDQRVTLRKISLELGLSHGSVQRIVSNVLRYSNAVL